MKKIPSKKTYQVAPSPAKAKEEVKSRQQVEKGESSTVRRAKGTPNRKGVQKFLQVAKQPLLLRSAEKASES